jgi:hypothetical protein
LNRRNTAHPTVPGSPELSQKHASYRLFKKNHKLAGREVLLPVKEVPVKREKKKKSKGSVGLCAFLKKTKTKNTACKGSLPTIINNNNKK